MVCWCALLTVECHKEINHTLCTAKPIGAKTTWLLWCCSSTLTYDVHLIEIKIMSFDLMDTCVFNVKSKNRGNVLYTLAVNLNT